ncbi:coproporphyrinogen-III oxidase family protein [Micromonospora sp. NBC_01412]|uniref:coproporphyrinogen-III oxidase family protein n=1 Tax=Micromonospora sp. NBC_01412 TaxID=2903590 RepID=UPI003248D17A
MPLDAPQRDCEYVTYFPLNITPLAGSALREGRTDASAGFGVYIHVPLCDRICPFCNYNKFPAESHSGPLVEGMLREIAGYDAVVSPSVRKLDFVYFGGGTPSVLRPSEIRRLLDRLRERFDLDDTEVNLECHPSHATVEYLAGLRSAGVNRISFGVQSFQDEVLSGIGSYHRAAQSLACTGNARAAGFDNIAIDLMFMLPDQDRASWQRELDVALEQGPEHISLYRMLLDPAGPLGRSVRFGRTKPQGGEALELELAALGLEVIGGDGYRHYGSCSSAGFDLCRPGTESAYEMCHRAAPQSEYVGIGPGAVGYLNGHVYWNVHTIREYLEVVSGGDPAVLAGRRLTDSDYRSRYWVLGVKHLAVPLAPFEERFGTTVTDAFPGVIDRLAGHGLAELGDDTLTVTPRGVHYMDNISKSFFNADNARLPQPYKPELQLLSVELFGTPA